MSMETSEWLNTQTLIGFTDRRGHAWHWRQSSQGAEPNHYPGPIPPDDVLRRLFNWEPVVGIAKTTVRLGGKTKTITDPKRKTIVHPTTEEIFAYVSGQKGQDKGYRIHGYESWLLDEIETVTGDGKLGLSSAGLLAGGGVAWVQAEMDESIDTPEGMTFRPFITASSSLDLSHATQYGAGSELVVCDNTLDDANARAKSFIRIRHTRNSDRRRAEIPQALELVEGVAEDTAAEIKRLAEIDVSDAAWAKFLDLQFPQDEDERGRDLAELSKLGAARRKTIRDGKRDAYMRLWNNDARVSPWRGTALGVLQVANTHETHEVTVKGMGRPERNMVKVIDGAFSRLADDTLRKLSVALAA